MNLTEEIMGLFGKKVKTSKDAQDVLIAAKEILKNGAEPKSIRAAISQALKDQGFKHAGVGESAEISVTAELYRNHGVPGDSPDAVEDWGKAAGREAIQKAFADVIPCLSR